MCDTTALRNWLLGIAAAIVAAIAFIVIAAVTNGSFWLAWQSPGWMLAAAAATGVAIFLCGKAMDALDEVCSCLRGKCADQCSNIRNVLNAAKVVLGIQATACLLTAAYAWIPWGAQPSMWVIVGALFIQAALIISAIAFLNQLNDCAKSSAEPPGSFPPGQPSGPGTTTTPVG